LLLLALLGGVGVYAASGNKGLGFATGASIALIALLVLYQQGKADRSDLEEEIGQLDEQEQLYWRPVIEHPELIADKINELFTTAA
jgi:hypothetical protein